MVSRLLLALHGTFECAKSKAKWLLRLISPVESEDLALNRDRTLQELLQQESARKWAGGSELVLHGKVLQQFKKMRRAVQARWASLPKSNIPKQRGKWIPRPAMDACLRSRVALALKQSMIATT